MTKSTYLKLSALAVIAMLSSACTSTPATAQLGWDNSYSVPSVTSKIQPMGPSAGIF